MELSKIEVLLEKYWDGETSIDEENILKNYFNSGDIAPHLQQYGTLFEYYKEEQGKTLASNFKFIPKKEENKFLKYALVASVVLFIAMFLGNREYDKYQQRKQFAEIKKALYLLSTNLNKGNDAIYEVSMNLSKGSDAVSKLDTYEMTAKKVINKIND